jgi:hypothetical protein
MVLVLRSCSQGLQLTLPVPLQSSKIQLEWWRPQHLLLQASQNQQRQSWAELHLPLWRPRWKAGRSGRLGEQSTVQQQCCWQHQNRKKHCLLVSQS